MTMHPNRATILKIVLSAIILLTNACDYFQITSEQRNIKAEDSQGDIVIGVVGSSGTQNLFIEGVKLAVMEINHNGGIYNRHLHPIFFDEKGSLSNALRISNKLSRTSDVIAVIGHNFSRTAIPASIAYENSGILLISSGATHLSFTQYGDKYTFRNVPSDEISAQNIAQYLKNNNLKRIVSLFDSLSYKRGLAESFHEKAIEQGLSIRVKKAYFSWQTSFREMLSDIKKKCEFDAIFIAGLFPTIGEIIKQARLVGITNPIISDFTLDSPELLNIAGKYAENTITATIFDPRHPNKQTTDFVEYFKTEYGVEPDTWAALGYDAIQLLFYAMNQCHSSAPIAISGTLRFISHWQGVTGSYSFTSDGSIIDKAFFYKQVKNEEFVYINRDMKSEDLLSGQIKNFTLRLPMGGKIQTIDPGQILDMNSIELSEQLFLSLTDLNPETYDAIPELATHWDHSMDGKSYIFHLRKNARWTDGKPVTAHDVVWAIQRNILPQTNSPNVAPLFIIKNARNINSGIIKDISRLGVKAIDDYSVEFQLEYPAAYFPSMTGMGVFKPLPKHVIEQYGKQWTDIQTIQTNGSYQLIKWEKGVKVILRKNELYYDSENVSIPIVVYYIIPDSKVGLAMYRKQEIDILGEAFLSIPSIEIQRLINRPNDIKEYYQEPNFCTSAYAFNTRLAPVDQSLIRQAISHAINRKLIIKYVIRGNEQPATTFTRPPIFGAVSPNDHVGIDFNPHQAQNKLKQVFDSTETIPTLRLAFLRSPTNKKIAQAIQSFLKLYLNITLEINALDMNGIVKANSENTPYHLFQCGWCADYPDANNFLNERFHPTESLNPVGWGNEEYASLMDMSKGNSNPDIRKQLYRRAEEILCEEECVVIPLYYMIAHYLVNPRVKGWYHMAMGGQHLRNWYLEK